MEVRGHFLYGRKMMSKTNEEKLAEAKERVKSLVSGEKDAEILETLIEAGAEINPKEEVGRTKLMDELSKDGQVFECSPNSSELIGEQSKDDPVFECSPNSLEKAKSAIWFASNPVAQKAEKICEQIRRERLLASKSKD